MKGSSEELVNALKKLSKNDESVYELRTDIRLELDERIANIQDQLSEFDDISKSDWKTIDNILTSLRNRIECY